MVHLRVKELAERQGLRLAQVQRQARLSVTTARRYWYNSRSGLARDAGTLTEVNLATLGAIAALLDVQPGDLLAEAE
ncbi:MAG: helix-turn-helix transcriptional regulator [Chloroflexales bacterium]|nr:helix-turn-helix transcriptional regulator [Chloroflexales bacterium]